MKEQKNATSSENNQRGGFRFSEDSLNPAERIIALTIRAKQGWKQAKELDELNMKLEESWDDLKKRYPHRFKKLRKIMRINKSNGWY